MKDLFRSGGRDLKGGPVEIGSAVLRSAVERAVHIGQARIGALPVRGAAFEAIENGLSAGCCDFEDGPGATCATCEGSAVERAVHIGQAGIRLRSVGAAFETIEDPLPSGGGNLVDGPAATGATASHAATAGRRAVERAVHVSKGRDRGFAVGSALEPIENVLFAGCRNRKDRSAPITADTAGAAPGIGRAVERAVHIGKAFLRVSAVTAACEAMKNAFRSGFADLKDASEVVGAALEGSAVKCAADCDQGRLRVHSVGPGAESVKNLLLDGRLAKN